jgi:hypothetical protein
MVTFSPTVMAGLEVGAARIIHGLRMHATPFRGTARLFSAVVARSAGTNRLEENQLASVFARWAAPGTGFEVFGEYLRDDYPSSVRQLLELPDDLSAWTVGVQRVLSPAARTLTVIRWEMVDGQLSPSVRQQRPDYFGPVSGRPLPPYLHGVVRQGHTHMGQLLGSPEAYGGSAWRTSVDRYDASGRTTISVDKVLQTDWQVAGGNATNETPEVHVGIGVDVVRFRSGRQWSAGVRVARLLNRALNPGDDRTIMRATLGVIGR